METKIYVLPVENGWAVKREGEQEPVATYKTKEEAADRGRAEARMNEAKFYIRNENGQDELSDDFTNVPAI